jgi:hypothetical protein
VIGDEIGGGAAFRSGSDEAMEGQFRSLEILLGAKRARLLGRLDRLEFGAEVTLDMIDGERVTGQFRECDGFRIVLVDGRVYPVRRLHRFESLS